MNIDIFWLSFIGDFLLALFLYGYIVDAQEKTTVLGRILNVLGFAFIMVALVK